MNEERSTGVKNPNQLRSYLKDRFPQYIQDADMIIYTYNASIEKIVSVITDKLIVNRLSKKMVNLTKSK